MVPIDTILTPDCLTMRKTQFWLWTHCFLFSVTLMGFFGFAVGIENVTFPFFSYFLAEQVVCLSLWVSEFDLFICERNST